MIWKLTPRRSVILLVLIVGGLALIAGAMVIAPVLQQFGEGTQGTAMYIGESFVDIEDGFVGDRITWVVVRNWPAKSSSSERLNDDRFQLMAIPRTVRMPDGSRQAVSRTPHVYFFDGTELTMFPVKMTEDDIAEVHGRFRGLTDYRQMLPLLKRYEVTGP